MTPSVSSLSPEDLASLQAHQIVVFRNRVIFNAQPPIDDATLAWVQSQCAGPLPSGLLELWQLTAGGNIDYDVTISMGGGTQSFSWTELFYRGAQTYFDLDGWIIRELEGLQESAEESGAASSGKLEWLPIGGFEYLDRVYVRTVDDDQHGAVVLWMQGLPAAWTHRLHENSTGWFAADLGATFDKMYLAEHPLDGAEEYRAGTELVRYIDEAVEAGMDRALADRLIEFYASATLDWRPHLADGTIGSQMSAVRSAFGAAARADDSDLVHQLAAAGVDFSEPLTGSAYATDLAIAGSHTKVLRALLSLEAPVDPDCLRGIRAPIDPELISLLIARGAEPTADHAANAVAVGAPEAARVILAAFADSYRGITAKAKVRKTTKRAFDQAIAKYQESLTKVQSESNHFHWLGADGLATRIERLQSFTGETGK